MRGGTNGPRPRVGGAEVDAFSRFGRKYLKWGHSERAKIKRTVRRRERRAERMGAADQ